MSGPKKIVVVGTTFGRMYIEAIRRCPGTRLAAIVARGSDVSRRTAAAAGVPLLTSTSEIEDDTDLACVAVRAGSIGGAGTTIAAELLQRGISVLHELPVGSNDVTACLRAAKSGKASFAVANLYRRLPSVRAFLAAARELIATEPPLAVDAHLSIQPAYALADLLTEISIPPRPISLAPVDGASLVTGSLGGVPLAIRYATVLDTRDTDNDVRFPSVSVHSGSGTLTLTDVHGPVLWTPTLHLPAEAKNTATPGSTQLTGVAASDALFAPAYTHAEVLTELWPTALAHEIEAALRDTTSAAAQRTLRSAQLWESITSGVDFPDTTAARADFGDRAALLSRLRTAADEATSEPAPYDRPTLYDGPDLNEGPTSYDGPDLNDGPTLYDGSTPNDGPTPNEGPTPNDGPIPNDAEGEAR